MQDLRRQFGIALRWSPLVVLAVVLAVGGALLLTNGQPRVYEASTRLIVDPGPNPSVNDIEVATELARRWAQIATTREILAAVDETVGLDASTGSASGSIVATTAPDSSIVRLDVRREDPDEAVAISLAVADELRRRASETVSAGAVRDVDTYLTSLLAEIERVQTRLTALLDDRERSELEDRELIALEGRLATLQGSYAQLLPLSSIYQRNRLEYLDRPVTPTRPVGPGALFIVLVAAMAGLVIAAAIAFTIEFLRDVVRDERDVEAATGLPSMGSVDAIHAQGGTASDALVVQTAPGSPAAEAYRKLRTKVAYATGPVRTLLVAGVEPTGSASVVAANLAYSYAETGQRVILMDGDLRAPRLHALFNARNELGLTTLLTGGGVALEMATLPTAHPNLRLLPSGPPLVNAAEVVASAGMRMLMSDMLQQVEMVIVDGPSLHMHLDSTSLASLVQASILVVERDSARNHVIEAVDALRSVNATVVGTVLFRSQRSRPRVAGPRPRVLDPARGGGHQPDSAAAQPSASVSTSSGPFATGPFAPEADTATTADTSSSSRS